MPEEDEREILHALETPDRLVTTLEKFTLPEVRSAIKQLRSKQAPGRDLITGKIVQELPDIGIIAITQIINSVLRTGYFRGQWKVSYIIIVLKPGKTAEEVMSYRPTSLLPIFSILYEKLFLTRIKPLSQETRIIPDHQLCFRQKHSTTEQVHRITNVINKALESKTCCAAALLDSGKTFDKVWHEGLLYKIKTLFPASI